ncbi:MAG: hypothetical protein E6J28_05360 [Chloroflexi bacterium]|nr:MAG: hypothetical protein E6J28_05360 [Chloroflexota bacterium]
MKPAGSLLAALGQAIVPLVAAAGGVLLLSGCTSCQSTVRTAAMPVIAAGSFDAVEADPTTNRLYLADQTAKGVDVVDISAPTPRFVSTIAMAAAPSGLAIAPQSHRLFASLGSDGGVAVVDTEPRSSNWMQVISTFKVDAAVADLIDYSEQTKNLYVGTEAGVIVVDTTTERVVRRLTTSAPVEQPRYDAADGMVYVTVPATDSLVQLNPGTGLVTRTYVISKCHPSGLAINPSRQVALLACGGSIALVNLESGAQEVTRVVQGGDLITYDSTADRFVVASPHDTQDSAVGVFAGDGSFIGSVPATPMAHGAAFDGAHGLVYAPSTAGLMSFAPAACAPPPDWLKFLGGLSIFAVPFLVLASIPVLYVRWRTRQRARPAGQTFRDLQDEDLEHERERMRALEDAIYGPQVAD